MARSLATATRPALVLRSAGGGPPGGRYQGQSPAEPLISSLGSLRLAPHAVRDRSHATRLSGPERCQPAADLRQSVHDLGVPGGLRRWFPGEERDCPAGFEYSLFHVAERRQTLFMGGGLELGQRDQLAPAVLHVDLAP